MFYCRIKSILLLLHLIFLHLQESFHRNICVAHSFFHVMPSLMIIIAINFEAPYKNVHQLFNEISCAVQQVFTSRYTEPTKHIPWINSTVATCRELTTVSAHVETHLSSRRMVMLQHASRLFSNAFWQHLPCELLWCRKNMLIRAMQLLLADQRTISCRTSKDLGVHCRILSRCLSCIIFLY